MKEFELEPGEHVVLQLRKHWFLFIAGMLPYAILIVLPFALSGLLTIAPPLAVYADLFTYQTVLMRSALGIWLLIIWTGAWGSFTRFYLNSWVLTNQRVVTIKQRRFFVREVSSLLLPRVQDVTTNITGLLSSLLNIGDIKVQSAGAEIEFTMRGIGRPEQMRDLIHKYVSEASKNQHL